MSHIVDNKAASSHSVTWADRVFYAMQEDTVRGVLSSEQRLSETELAEHYGVLRGPLREAMRRLEAQRLINRTPHVGVRIASLSSEKLMQLYSVREIMEGMAVRLAAAQPNGTACAVLQNLLTVHQDMIAADDGRSYFQNEGDLDFHYQIAQLSGNSVLAQLLGGELYYRIRQYRYRFSTNEGRPSQALAEHQRILDAIVNKDPELAELLMRRHIRTARTHVEMNFTTKHYTSKQGESHVV